MTENQKQNRYGKKAGTDSFKGKDKRTDTKKKAEPDFNSKQTRKDGQTPAAPKKKKSRCPVSKKCGGVYSLLPSFKIRVYDEDRGTGLLKFVQVRTAHVTRQIMVTLVVTSPVFPSRNNFVKALRKLHPEITTIVMNINDKHTTMVLGKREQVLFGKGYIEDQLCGKTFRISSQSFYQVNSIQTEKLYNIAIDYAGLSGKERILDAYCGIGTIGIIASDRCKEVISVELNPDAVKDAVRNAKANDASNVSVYQGDAGKFMTSMAEQGEKLDVLFMDPPRSGSTEEFIRSAGRLAPSKIVYISCNPRTLGRDLELLEEQGYVCRKAVPVDMFPYTMDVETVCLLSNRKPDSYVHLNLKMEDYYRIKDAQKEQDKK